MIKIDDYKFYVNESFLDYPDNTSLAVIFYMPGCDRKCVGCQNSELKKFEKFENKEKLVEFLIIYLRRSNTNKLVLQGGDPLFKDNLELTRFILQKMGDKYDICIYTGADIDEVKKLNLRGFKYIKCGKFEQKKFVGSIKTDEYIRFATTNQYLINDKFECISKENIYYF